MGGHASSLFVDFSGFSLIGMLPVNPVKKWLNFRISGYRNVKKNYRHDHHKVNMLFLSMPRVTLINHIPIVGIQLKLACAVAGGFALCQVRPLHFEFDLYVQPSSPRLHTRLKRGNLFAC